MSNFQNAPDCLTKSPSQMVWTPLHHSKSPLEDLAQINSIQRFPTNDLGGGSPSPPPLFAEHWVWTGSGGKPWLQAWIVICMCVDSNTAHRASLATALFKILSCTRPLKWVRHRGWRNP